MLDNTSSYNPARCIEGSGNAKHYMLLLVTNAWLCLIIIKYFKNGVINSWTYLKTLLVINNIISQDYYSWLESQQFIKTGEVYLLQWAFFENVDAIKAFISNIELLSNTQFVTVSSVQVNNLFFYQHKLLLLYYMEHNFIWCINILLPIITLLANGCEICSINTNYNFEVYISTNCRIFYMNYYFRKNQTFKKS